MLAIWLALRLRKSGPSLDPRKRGAAKPGRQFAAPQSTRRQLPMRVICAATKSSSRSSLSNNERHFPPPHIHRGADGIVGWSMCRMCSRCSYVLICLSSSTVSPGEPFSILSTSTCHLNMAVVQDEAGEAGVVQAVKLLRTYWYLALPLVLALRFFYYKLASPLRNYPGPFLASGSRAWKGKMPHMSLCHVPSS